jgi:branched-chain amino acid transport system substrate-binding protein
MAEGEPGKETAAQDVSTAARNLKGFKGISGSIEFDNKGDPVKAKYFVLQFDKKSDPGKVVKVIDQQEPAAAKKS